MAPWTRRLSNLDGFKKIERSITQSSSAGGLLTLLVIGLLIYLLLAEFRAFIYVKQNYEFLVDQTRSQRHDLQINIDMTINTPCPFLRADVLDLSGQSLPVSEQITATPVGLISFASKIGDLCRRFMCKMTMEQVTFTDKGIKSAAHRDKSDFLENEENIRNLLYAAGRERNHGDIAHTRASDMMNGACRLHGSFKVHKIAGMFHITALGHGHGGAHVDHDRLNFTHRVDRLSFGPLYPGLKNPLDHTLEVSKTNFENYQYNLAVVPTIYIDETRWFNKIMLTNQYSVTESQKILDPEHPDSFPGIFIKYDIEPISVRVTSSRLGLVQFTTRICGIIGGIYVTSGMIYSFLSWIGRQLGGSKKSAVA